MAEPAGEVHVASEPSRAFAWTRGLGPLLPAHAVLLVGLITALFLMFVLIEPTPQWIILFGAAATGFALDGVLRVARRRPFELGADTIPYLFLPTLYVLAIPVFIEYNAASYWVLLLGVLAGAGFGAVVMAEIGSVREFDPARTGSRLVATVATYVVAFALFSLTYSFDLELPAAPVAAGIVALLLAVEVVREGEVDPRDTLVLAGVVGIVVGEGRLALHYLPLDGHLAAIALLLTFFAATGLLHAHQTRQLSRSVLIEYSALATVGFMVLALARAAGLD